MRKELINQIIEEIDPILYAGTPMQIIDKVTEAVSSGESPNYIIKNAGGKNFDIVDGINLVAQLATTIGVIYTIYAGSRPKKNEIKIQLPDNIQKQKNIERIIEITIREIEKDKDV